MTCISREEGPKVKFINYKAQEQARAQWQYIRDGVSNNKFGYNSRIMRGYQKPVDSGPSDNRYGVGVIPGPGQFTSIYNDGRQMTIQQGILPQGTMPQGMMPQGMMPQGVIPPGMTPQGMTPQGMMQQGMRPQGMMPQGMMPQGMMPQRMMPQASLSDSRSV
jgi:hypothetical protein